MIVENIQETPCQNSLDHLSGRTGVEEYSAPHRLLRQHGLSRKGGIKLHGHTEEKPHEELSQSYRGLLIPATNFMWLPLPVNKT